MQELLIPPVLLVFCLTRTLTQSKYWPILLIIYSLNINRNRCWLYIMNNLLEILSQQTKIECLENLEVLKELANGYKDSYITAHLLAEYNRIAFVRLMILLNKEGIENNIRNMLIGL